MSTINIEDELIIAGVARATESILSSNGFIDRVVDAILLRFEILTPQELANFIGVTTRTLGENHVDYGFDKSVALGPNNPRYLLSQVVAALKVKVIKGRRPEKEKPAALKLEGNTAA